jgi:hypothetical protein
LSGRLVDEFEVELARRSLAVPGELEICGVFGDLLWPPCGNRDWHSRVDVDPAFTLTGYSRWVALARIDNEIRFYAAPLPEGFGPWWWSGEDPARVAAVKAEPDVCELASFGTIGDAVSFAVAYLRGVSFERIDVVRIRPGKPAAST